jgi:phosphoribosylaminoimidazole-succinocarboxamide synthase
MSDSSAALTQIRLPGLKHLRSGKVREIFEVGDEWLIVASDRISAFDCILPTGIPGKGKLLTRMSVFWFGFLGDRVPHHLITAEADEFPSELAPFRVVLEGRSMLVRRADMIPIECVARGYLAGSAWQEYRRTGEIAGMPLPPGLRQSSKLPQPLFTPATKADEGHDVNITFAEMEGIVGGQQAQQLRELTLGIYRRAAAFAAARGIIIADTKVEFGIIDDRIVLADEVLTPDSSRFWPAKEVVEGSAPPSFDKQYVRDYLASLAWDRSPPAPPLPPEVVVRSSEKYREVYRRLTSADGSL